MALAPAPASARRRSEGHSLGTEALTGGSFVLLAATVFLSAIYVENYLSESRLVNSTDWVLLTRNQTFLDLEAVHEDEEPMPAPGPLWTDDFSSLFEVVEFDN